MAFNRRVLKINGAERSFICDDEKDTLADAIRNLGLTGTKVGCGKGQCGACNVILDGKLVRSCTRKMKLVKDYSSVTTIEGLATAETAACSAVFVPLDSLSPQKRCWTATRVPPERMSATGFRKTKTPADARAISRW